MLGRFTILATLAVLATAAPAGAATIVVDQAADSAASGGCAAADDDCSLRQAVTAAAVGDTITIAADADPLITLGEIPITKDVTIVGIGGRVDRAPAFDGTVIDANLTSRIFNVAAAAEVTLRDLLLVRGKAPDGVVTSPRGGGNGGAVLSNGALRLERVTVAGESCRERHRRPSLRGRRQRRRRLGVGAAQRGRLDVRPRQRPARQPRRQRRRQRRPPIRGYRRVRRRDPCPRRPDDVGLDDRRQRRGARRHGRHISEPAAAAAVVCTSPAAAPASSTRRSTATRPGRTEAPSTWGRSPR